MATTDLLPATTYQPPSPVQARRRRRSLNTIIEDEEESTEEVEIEEARTGEKETVTDWQSPWSDHFPTPRGNHFMPAPYIASSPSSVGTSEFSQSSSAPCARDSFGTQVTEFEELYDVSSDEEDDRQKNARIPLARNSGIRKSTASDRLSTGSNASRRSLPSLVIPSSPSEWPRTPSYKLSSPIPPTPPPKVPMSPAIFSFLAAQDVPSSSAPPSLDGSLTSEQMAAMSAPPTPNLSNHEGEDGRDRWDGVQLQPAAMATLQALSGEDLFEQHSEQVIEVSQMSPTREMQQSPPPASSNIHRHDSVVLSPAQQSYLNSLSRLDIPSPGGFFASLTPNSQRKWNFGPSMFDAEGPPSSTTAEHFYKTPWSCEPVERIVEVPEILSDECSTARPTVNQQDSDETVVGLSSPVTSQDEEIVPTEILTDYDEGYARRLNDAASQNIDRTIVWLSAQTTYLSALINPPEDRDDEAALQKRVAGITKQIADTSASPPKKSVRFSEIITRETKQAIGARLPKATRQESTYYRSFLGFVSRSRPCDTYVHHLPRFEALQIQRINFPEAHRNQLLGKYQLSVTPMSVKKRMSANVARGDALTVEDPVKLKADREREAMEQMSGATWNVMAVKMLNGGRLIAAPVAKRLARLTSMGPTTTGVPRERARILDLGGQGSCDWAWHCAFEYPNTKVYTVSTKALRQLSNANINGPQNHRQVAVFKLTKLPFADKQFDLISARHLHSMLKVASENGSDEYDACLAECMRVLKPGGYLEFSLLDSDIMNAGSLGQAKSVEFGFSLKLRGYDATPTRAFLGRLRHAGFVNVKRAWMFLPMGAPLPPPPASRDSLGVEVKLELEAMVTGSTNAAANITGLMGAWAWEKWMLKLQMESGMAEGSLLDGVHSILEEGRKCGAGWRALSGWARRPL
ncbi:MAG: hypothetical protein M1818_008258 [Claussenomyces sp. TS43310]|nr:MAG: hypothetical protein M1818_008258 [Claussenomyces sp. TS43310]